MDLKRRLNKFLSTALGANLLLTINPNLVYFLEFLKNLILKNSLSEILPYLKICLKSLSDFRRLTSGNINNLNRQALSVFAAAPLDYLLSSGFFHSFQEPVLFLSFAFFRIKSFTHIIHTLT